MTSIVDINLIREWIDEAGQIALEYFGDVQAEWKGIGDPVTQADREIEQFLTARIQQTYPDHGIIGEEYGAESLDCDYLWTIDPIDGTRAYIEGLPSWNITIALLHHLEPVFGLVHIPLYDDWTYTDGDDVIHNGTSIRSRLQSAWTTQSFLMVRSDVHTTLDIQYPRLMAMGTTACHMAYTARGSALATITQDSYVWDIAAGMAITRKQGGETRLLSGEPLDLRALDLTARIDGVYLTAHPAVLDHLIPLVHVREELHA